MAIADDARIEAAGRTERRHVGKLSVFPETALVTGGASGIVRAVVELLEAEGAEVLVLDLANGFDLSDAAAWETVEPVQLACLNARVVTGEGDLTALTDEQYRRVVGTTADGVALTAHGLDVRVGYGSLGGLE